MASQHHLVSTAPARFPRNCWTMINQVRCAIPKPMRARGGNPTAIRNVCYKINIDTDNAWLHRAVR